MSLGVFDRQRRSPSFAEALAANPPPPAAGDVAGQQRRHEARAAFEESEKAARDAEKERAGRDWTERMARQRKIEQQAATRQAAWAAEKQRLEAELDNARTAQGQLAAAGDCSTVEAAVAAIRAQALASAASVVVARCEGTLKAHLDSQRIR
jgi:hypothetical protein